MKTIIYWIRCLIEKILNNIDPLIRPGYQKKLTIKYDNWLKLYGKLHGYYPVCMMCTKHDKEFSTCYRDAIHIGQHPLNRIDYACMNFRLNGEGDADRWIIWAKEKYKRKNDEV